VPHAGEVVGAESVRTALDLLEPDRIRHGFRAIEDPALVLELADRGLVLDMTPISNVRTGAIRSLEEHPLPAFVAAGVRCSVSTDDPVMFDTDLTREYEAAERMGLEPQRLYETALAGALCDQKTKTRLAEIGAAYDWKSVAAEAR
jgi:aminodeoxyfutalosine deaminase